MRKPLFKWGEFVSSSGWPLDWKIECDNLTEEDWACIARVMVGRFPKIGQIMWVPSGGIPLAKAFIKTLRLDLSSRVTLIVDDVWTTGRSMRALAHKHNLIAYPSPVDFLQDFQWVGVVAFARTLPDRNVASFMMLT